MDLTIKLDSATLNIRVAVILKNKNGYIFEKHKSGYIFAIGGRVKLGESSLQAAHRELKEELLISDKNYNIELKYKAIIENFYTNANEEMHEICFVYEATNIYDNVLREELFIEVDSLDFAKHDIRPIELIDITNDKSGEFRNVVVGK